MEALDTIKRIVVGNASAKYPDAFDSFMLKCVVPIGNQVKNRANMGRFLISVPLLLKKHAA